MGDGRVALILDVLGLAQRASVIGEVRDRAVVESDEKQSHGASGDGQRSAVLLFQHGDAGRIAIDLSLVARLEEFPRDAIEVSADREVVQYRGEIMPLVRVSNLGAA
jgi:two-component system chemotaxis sensor kinase CheA